MSFVSNGLWDKREESRATHVHNFDNFEYGGVISFVGKNGHCRPLQQHQWYVCQILPFWHLLFFPVMNKTTHFGFACLVLALKYIVVLGGRVRRTGQAHCKRTQSGSNLWRAMASAD